jgi:transposase
MKGRNTFMFIVGVDVAKRSHEAIIIDREGSIVKKAFNFKNDATGFSKLKGILQSVSSSPSDFIIGMESTSHYWLALYSALKREGYPVHVLNPIQSNALRGMYIRQVKNDEHDSFIIAEVIRFGRYTEGGMPPSTVYELRELCRARTFIVDMTADLKHKVIALLDQAFPEYETIFTDIFGLTSSELLRTASTPDEILNVDTDKLARLIETSSRKRFGTAKAEEIKALAQNSFGIILEHNTMGILIKQHMEHIRFSEQQIAEIDSKIEELFSHFNTYITTIPGIGPTLGATIFSEIGDISRFESAAKLAAFAGIDPTVTQSGEFVGTHNHMSKRGSPYLRRALWQASTAAATFDPHMKAFFQKKRAEGKPYMNAIGHVTRKMTNIIFAVLRDNKPYYNPDEQ